MTTVSSGLTRVTPGPRLDRPGALVAGNEGILDRVAAHGVREVVVEIAAADTHGAAPDEDIVVPDDPRHRGFPDLDRPDAGEERGFHGGPIIRHPRGIGKRLIAAGRGLFDMGQGPGV